MMAKHDAVRFRHEYKYMLTPAQEAVLRLEVAGVMMPDKHAIKNGGTYRVRSLYFDDLHDTCLRENMNGADPRSKFRIRYYNDDLGYIRLEKKVKQRGMGIKIDCPLTPQECLSLQKGIIPNITSEMPEKKIKLLTELLTRQLCPRIIVEYMRIPFVYPAGNVRVTFDRCLSASDDLDSFMAGDYRVLPVMQDGMSLLEVKWDALLPRHIKELIQPENLTWTAFSKYALCRENSL